MGAAARPIAAKHLPSALVAAVISSASTPVIAQAWLVQSGSTARVEYNDNYFFTDFDTQSAITATISPFVAAIRRTETSDLSALFAIGANKVWGPTPSTEYLSARVGVDGTFRAVRTIWAGSASFTRGPSLQNELTPDGVVLTLAYLNSLAVNGSYDYEWSERLTLGVRAGAFDHRYAAIEGGADLEDSRGYSAGATAGYAFSERTQLTFNTVYGHLASDVTTTDTLTTTIGLVHRWSPRLVVSVSVGAFWSESQPRLSLLPCPSGPMLCEQALAGDATEGLNERRRNSGPLFGGGISYAYSESTRFSASISESLSPSGTGTVTRTDTATASVSHDFSERLTGNLGVRYSRSKFPALLADEETSSQWVGELGISYRLAERWTLDAGYRHTRADYSQSVHTPRSNVVFVGVGYNWPGASITDWVGTRREPASLSGAGPVLLPYAAPGTAQGSREWPAGPAVDGLTTP